MKAEFSQILADLDIPKKDALAYFHISADNLKTLFSTKEIVNELNNYFDYTSSIFMPSFPFSKADYYPYMLSDEVFNIKKTPCRVNLITEIFRRDPDVIRSLHPYLSVAGKGPMALDILNEHHKSIKLFDAKTPFYKIMQNNGYVIGLGVDCNTNSFAHLPDDLMLKYYNFSIYENKIYQKKCIDYDEIQHIIKTQLVSKDISKKIRPRNLKHKLRETAFYKEHQLNGIEFYSLKIKDYVQWVFEESIEDVKKTGKPLYYDE